MKSKIFALLLIIFTLSLKAQVQVPDNETFTLDDVWDAVRDHDATTTGDLSDCFANSEPTYFNSSYESSYYAAYGNKNNLLMFRDYGPHNAGPYIYFSSATAYNASTVWVGTPAEAAVGDLITIFVFTEPGIHNTSTAPTGYTLIDNATTSNSLYPNVTVWGKIAAIGDLGASTQVSLGGTTTSHAYGIKAVSRPKASSTVTANYGVTTWTRTSNNTTSINMSPLDKSSSYVLSFVAVSEEVTSWTTVGDGWTDIAQVDPTGTILSLYGVYKTGDPTMTFSWSPSDYFLRYAIEIYVE